ncbi:uclacyanin-3-like [Carya illinoinensis]|uniref:Phytocyanin domain-containing protein n=1 Tax=Carya illinoinensis TaxID=32201 RepID=A0A8T1PWR0_CARIL|nr:uclacyanin-3-like [Carya illinoinensis]KAG6645851.1 hypothetical protein CIPAW_08G151900 [Carya illinoinensis]
MACLATGAMILLSFMSAVGVCFGTVYKVGDSKGWTNETNVDYKVWSSNSTFFVGDTFFFQYDYKSNDVMEVSREDFESCNVRSPLNLYTSGRDSITMWKPGHYYYVCSFPGHCQAGQKVDIRVLIQPLNPTPSPGPSPLNPPTSSPSPSPSSTLPSTPSYQPTHPPSPSPSTSIPATPEVQSPHFSMPGADQAPAPSKNTAPKSFLPSKGLLSLHLMMAVGFLAYH